MHDSIQRNHAHLLVEADDREALARRAQPRDLLSRVAAGVQQHVGGASSARWLAGWRAGVAIDRSPPSELGSSPAVAEPRTWFLRLGWQRFGLLDPNEIPGGLAR